MISKYQHFLLPGLGVLCAAGAVWVVAAARAPVEVDVETGSEAAYEPLVPEKLVLDGYVPTMEEVVEKHLFVKERKATGANTFPDLLVKGVYVGEKQSVLLSLKSRPEINLRVWLDDVDGIISRITDRRDPRRAIVDFLNEWDIREITMKGVVVENFITGEVETYEVDYTPAKHVKDDAAAGYGQGALAQTSQGAATKKTTTKKQANQPAAQNTMQQRMQAFSQLRNMVEQMSPEQRARLADRIRGGGGGDRQNNNNNSSNNKNSSRNNGGSGSSRGGGGR